MRSLLLSTFLIASLTGCASMYVHGGRLSDQDLSKPGQHVYEAPNCTIVATGEPSPGSTARYFIVTENGQPALFERGDTGKGVVATNRWTAADGDHYLAWVTSKNNANGFEYVVPPQGPGKRLIYNHVELAKGADGVTKATSSPTYSCPLTPTS